MTSGSRRLAEVTATRSVPCFVLCETSSLDHSLTLPVSLQRHPAEVIWYLIPQALPFSIPAAVALGVCCGWSRRPAWRTLLARVALLGTTGALAALSTMEWLIPGANQEFHVMVMRQVGAERVHIVRGIGERSLSELLWLVRETSPD